MPDQFDEGVERTFYVSINLALTLGWDRGERLAIAPLSDPELRTVILENFVHFITDKSFKLDGSFDKIDEEDVD